MAAHTADELFLERAAAGWMRAVRGVVCVELVWCAVDRRGTAIRLRCVFVLLGNQTQAVITYLQPGAGGGLQQTATE